MLNLRPFYACLDLISPVYKIFLSSRHVLIVIIITLCKNMCNCELPAFFRFFALEIIVAFRMGAVQALFCLAISWLIVLNVLRTFAIKMKVVMCFLKIFAGDSVR